MMALSADAVKALRDRTGAGMMDCKAALQEAGGDLEKAIDALRKKGMASAAKRAGREAKEGIVSIRVDGQKAAIVEANSETDFVARTDDFKALVNLALDETFALGDKALNSEKIKHTVDTLSGKIGEKLLVRRVKLVETKGAALFSYVHANNKLGVIVELGFTKPETRTTAAFEALGKDLSMQIAAANPASIDRSGVSSALVDREKEIYKEEIKGKPENIVEKILQGKLAKFYQTVCLLEQPFIKDDKVAVQTLINETAKKLSDTITVKAFTRFQLGESVS